MLLQYQPDMITLPEYTESILLEDLNTSDRYIREF